MSILSDLAAELTGDRAASTAIGIVVILLVTVLVAVALGVVMARFEHDPRTTRSRHLARH